MHLRRVHHVSFAVRDLAAARRFYAGILGLEEIPRPDIGLPGAWFQLGDAQVHLIVPPAGAPVDTPPPRLSPVARHAAFEVADSGVARDALRVAGVEVLELGAEARQLFATDPDGNVIELIESGWRPGAARGPRPSTPVDGGPDPS